MAQIHYLLEVKLTKSEIMSNWESLRTSLKITRTTSRKSYLVIISPNEVFGDIMVLASPPRRREHSNSKNI